MKRAMGATAITAVLALGGCGDSGDDGGNGRAAADSGSGCLTAQEVQKQIDEIAGGFETSDAEVAAKQEQIRQLIKQAKAQEC